MRREPGHLRNVVPEIPVWPLFLLILLAAGGLLLVAFQVIGQH